VRGNKFITYRFPLIRPSGTFSQREKGLRIIIRNMILELHLTKNKATLYLKDGKNILDKTSWVENNNLSQKLLLEIDKIIRKNKLKKKDIKKMEVKSDIPVGYTTTRIARTVAKTYNFAV
jgi:tRNA A37 threonylcarbamoyladenosine modification protein TsaB